MKRSIKFLVMIIALVNFNPIAHYAQSNDDNGVKSAIKNLFEYSKSKAYDKAGKIIAYEGEDKDRVHKDSFNTENKEELNQVKRICKKITALLELSSKYEFGEISSPSKNVYSMQVTFVSGEQKLVTSFILEKTEKGFLLISMN